MSTQSILPGDCIECLKSLEDKSVDVVVTSPPYNLKIKYSKYKDNLSRQDYLTWLNTVFKSIDRVLKDDGSFFLNVGNSCIDPWIAHDAVGQARDIFKLQNNIYWIKSVGVDINLKISLGLSDMIDVPTERQTYGHFKPINSPRFLSNNTEMIYHLTKSGYVKIDKLAIGVPFADKSNIKRFTSNKQDKRCNGNNWHITYKTVNSKEEKCNHPATFPIELPKRCIQMHGITDNMLVVDPFSGIGTTMIACKELGVTGIGIELDENYVKVSKELLNGS